MAGHFTRKMYDGCAIQQDLKQSTDPLELVLDVNKYVHCNNICKPSAQYPPNAALLVDVESSLWGIDKIASRCDSAKHPFCGPNGCLLTKDPRVAPHITPYACERGHLGENAVITTNMQIPKHPGFRVSNQNICETQGNGYYVDQNRVRNQHPALASLRNQLPQIDKRNQHPQIDKIDQHPQIYKREQQYHSALAPLRNQHVKMPIQHATNKHIVMKNPHSHQNQQYIVTCI